MPVRDSAGMPVTIGGGGQRTIFVPWGCERIKNGKAARPQQNEVCATRFAPVHVAAFQCKLSGDL
jgi:hypothetical protein